MDEVNTQSWFEGNHTTPGKTFLRVDLASCTKIYLKYFDSWEVFNNTNDELLARRAVRRYERFWLTLLYQQHDQSHSEAYLEPPMDVHWIWHLHMLQPASYYVYCKQRFGRVLPHRFFRTENEIHANRLRTAAAWRKAFPSEPFELDLKEIEDACTLKFPTATRLDHLIDLARNEKHFKHRIAFAHFRDQGLHLSAESRYKQLLALKRSYDWEPRCLPTDIELVWRVHMLQPLHYIADIRRFLHQADGSASPFSVQSFLTTGIEYLESLSCSELMTFISVSNQFWKSVYQNEENLFFTDGTTPRSTPLNRGNAMTSIVLPFKSENYDGHAVEACNIIFTSLSVEELWTKQKNFKVSVKLLGVNSFKQELIFESKGVIGQVITQPDKKFRLQGVNDQNILGRCRFDPKENRGIELQVFSCQGFGCFIKHRLMMTKVFDPLQSIALNNCSQGEASISLGHNSFVDSKNMYASSDNINRRQQIIIPKITCTDPKVTLNYKIEISGRRPFQFLLDRNSGESTSLPEYLESLLSGIINWQESLSDFEHGKTFLVARHSLKCRDLGLAFGVEIVRNDFNNLFAVSLFHNNQHLVGIAYSIDQHYLANSLQVTDNCPLVFNPQKGDLAMAIRGHEGEELIMIAKWIEGINGENKVHLTTFDTKSFHTYTIQMQEDEQHSFSNDVITVELPSGRITASCSAGKVPNNIIWAFSVGCLYISMQRPNSGSSVKDSTSILSLPSGDGSVRSSSAQFSLDGSNDISSIGRKNKKKTTIQQYRHNKKANKRRKMSASFTFLLACGFRIEMAVVPSQDGWRSSSNLRSNHGSMVDIASFSYLNDSQKSHHEPRMSSRSCAGSTPQDYPRMYNESRVDCENVETSYFERV